ncbi:MAG TPA: bifunctional hydroxymethylpyrimidine kinase/phosphomethylpyrimidine kinase [Terriglobales bacterium]|nr:bifunctional hydroxymethylpyrimidine kinase/phosphomethylpyrimidine kinase [Terriglobales bacterium]
MPQTPPVVLTIAGFDPSSGAGITADIKTIAAHGCYGVACITALTVQSTQGVSRVEALPARLVSETLKELSRDVEIAAVKIGMLGSADVVAAVCDFLEPGKPANVVLDPILRSSSGARLLEPKGEKLMGERLLPLATVITPNLDEATALSGVAVTNLEEMKAAALRLHELGALNVVVTGGHLDKATDLLSFTHPNGGIQTQVFKAERQRSRSTHGTGCAFASALACHLAHGRGLPEAVLLAKAYVAAAITHAQPLGRGTGPLDHLYRMHEPPRRQAAVADPEPVG